MNGLTDQQLLRDYAEHRSDAAFGELVRRHLDLVYSAALRMVRDAHLAEDVTQGVFVALARSAARRTDCAVLAGWLHRTEIAAIATDTWGFEVRPNEFDDAFQPLHQVTIPHLGLLIGEMWALEDLAEDCAADGVYEFFLTAAPLPITGAVGSPVNPIAVK